MAESKDRPEAPVGAHMRATGKDGPQVVRRRRHQWSDAAEQVFLDELGASCNVTRAAAACGFSTVVAHRRRRVDPAFSEKWRIAMEQGYMRIEMLLIQRATETLEGYLPDPDTPIPVMGVKDAIAILQMYRATVTGGSGKYPGARAGVRSLDQVRRSILTKLEAIETKRRLREAGEGTGA